MLWYLSFCDSDRPEGQQFLGAAIVNGFDIMTAASEAHARGCNPGGEVVGMPIPDESEALFEPYTNRLMSKSDVDAMDAALEEDDPPDTERGPEESP